MRFRLLVALLGCGRLGWVVDGTADSVADHGPRRLSTASALEQEEHCDPGIGGIGHQPSLALLQVQAAGRAPRAERRTDPMASAPTAAASGPVARLNAAADAQARLALLRPLAWVHMPKCGTSFLSTLYNHPGICPSALVGAKLPSSRDFLEPMTHFLEQYPEDTCCRGSSSASYTFMWNSRMHIGIGLSLYEANKGHAITMLRQPEQRIISSYHDHIHDWNGLIPPRDIREFAEAVQGCQVKMVVRTSDSWNTCAVSWGAVPPSDEEVSLAVRHLREGFAFVGLADRWDLSVCLFHAKFGGRCSEAEFDNMRLGSGRSEQEEAYDTSELRGFTDDADRQLYAEAVKIFEADSVRFSVSEETCRRTCWGQPS